MIAIKHTVKDRAGMHARPAGQLTQAVSRLTSDIKMELGGKKADCRQMIPLMRLGIKYGDEVTITVEGKNELADSEAIKVFAEEVL